MGISLEVDLAFEISRTEHFLHIKIVIIMKTAEKMRLTYQKLCKESTRVRYTPHSFPLPLIQI